MGFRPRDLCVIAALLIAGCSAESQSELTREVRDRAPPGSDTGQAEAALKSAGFDCGSVTVPSVQADRECDRTRGGTFLTGCVQRAYLTYDSSRRRIQRVDVLKPACAGL